MIKVGVVIFPGTNCDKETIKFLKTFKEFNVYTIWHRDTNIELHDLYVFPGGFSYGDYLRAGKIATFSPAVEEIEKHIRLFEKKALGICNGFQILCELDLLPGTLRINDNLKFICKPITICDSDDEYVIPIAHGMGNYYHPHPEMLNVAYRYYNDNPNGSVNDIAGIYNWRGNVLGLMPHPERAFENHHASKDGYKIIENFFNKEFYVL